MNILVTDGNTRPALAIVRSLGSKANRLFVGEKKQPSLASSSRYCFESFVYPDPAEDSDRFIDTLIQVIREYDVDVVLPVTDITTLSITANKKEIEQFCAVPFADYETINFLSNKFEVLKLAANGLDIPIPKTTFIVGKDQIRELPEGLIFPVVIKPSRSRINLNNKWISTAVLYANSLEELNHILENKSEMEFPIMLQERIIGPGIGVFLCYNKGKCIAYFCHRRLREKPPSGGVSVLCESIPILPLAKQFAERLLNSLNWHGVAMVEFKLDQRDNIPKLMEINSRFWGSLQLAISSGVDFPSILIETAKGNKNIRVFDYKTFVKNRWLWGDIDRILLMLLKSKDLLNLPPGHEGKFMSVLSFFKMFGKELHYDVLWLSDIKPWICETVQRLTKSC